MATFEELLNSTNEVSNKVSNLSESELRTYQVSPLAELDDEWIRSDKYTWYDEYVDDMDYSIVDDKKNVSVNKDQINLTQEKNSQIISFIMPRYSDGIDIANSATLNFHIVNSTDNEYMLPAVNVSYNSSKIRFHFLLNEYATYQDGVLRFEIIATGNTSAGQYVWKTRPNSEITILESLSGIGTIEPGDGWDSYINLITSRVTDAQNAAQQAQSAAAEASSALSQIDSKVSTATDTITQNVLTNIEDELSKYYTSEEVDNIIANLDFSNVIAQMEAKIQGVHSIDDLLVKYDDGTLTLYDMHGTEQNIIASIAVGLSSSDIEGILNRVRTDIVDPVSEELSDYKTSNNAAVNKNTSDISSLSSNLENNYYTAQEVDNAIKNSASASDVLNLKTRMTAVESGVASNTNDLGTLSSTVQDLSELINNFSTDPSLKYRALYPVTLEINGEEQQNYFQLIEITPAQAEGEEDTEEVVSQFQIVGGGGGGSTSNSKITLTPITQSPLVSILGNTVTIEYFYDSISGDEGDEYHNDATATWKINGSVLSEELLSPGQNYSFDATKYVTTGTQRLTLTITDSVGSISSRTWSIQIVDVSLSTTFDDRFTYSGDVSFSYTPRGSVSKTIHFILDGKELGSVTTTSSSVPMSYIIPQQSHGSHLLEIYMTATVGNNVIETEHIYKDILWMDESNNTPAIGCSQQNITALQYDNTNIIYTVYDPNTETPTVILSVDGVVTSTLTLNEATNIWQYKTEVVGSHTLTIACRNTVKTIHVNIEKLDIDINPVTAGLEFDFNPSGRTNSDEDLLWKSDINPSISMTVSENFNWSDGGYGIDSNGDTYFCVKAGTRAIISHNLFSDDARQNGKEFKIIYKVSNVRQIDTTFLSCIQDGVGLNMRPHETYITSTTGELYEPLSEEDIIEFEFNITKISSDIPMVMTYEDGVAARPMIYDSTHNFTQTSPVPITIGSDECDVYIYRIKAYSQSLEDSDILSNFIADARNADEMISRYKRNQIYDTETGMLTAESIANACPDLRVIKISAPHFTKNKSDKVDGTTIQMIYKNGDPLLDNWICTGARHSGQGTSSNAYWKKNIDAIMNTSTSDITLGDGITKPSDGKVNLTRSSIPSNYFNIKVNVASSENANNALLQKRYDRYLPYTSLAKQNDSRVKNTMEFFNCVIFVQETDTDMSTHQVAQDNDWHFYSIGNIGDSKKTDSTRANDPTDPKEFCVEIMDWDRDLSFFPTGSDALSILNSDLFDESGTYGMRYGKATEENIQVWKDFYTFITKDINENDSAAVNAWKEEFQDWFILDAALYYYLFTLRYTLVDNRAKNTFWHYGKCIDGKYRFDFWDYDNDTALGINNTGKLTMTYGVEDEDIDSAGSYYFRGALSTFFMRIKKFFGSELMNTYKTVESLGCWSADSLITEFDEWQGLFPEELWRLNYEEHYINTYKQDQQYLRDMMNGRKKYHRRQYERDQEIYMASLFISNKASTDLITLRCTAPESATIPANYIMNITPYSNMYLNVYNGQNLVYHERVKAGETYTVKLIEDNSTASNIDFVYIYNASRIQSLGDMSKLYLYYAAIGSAEKLQELIIGNDEVGYTNMSLTSIGLGTNTLLNKVDLRNVPNLNGSIDFSGCPSLEEIYATGSGINGIIFASGGKLRVANLPGITTLTMKNLYYVEDLSFSSFDNLATLTIENSPSVDSYDIVNRAKNLYRTRLIGINWDSSYQISNTNILERLYNLAGIDNGGYNTARAVLSGYVYAAVVKQKLLSDFREAWSDLEIEYNSLIEQFTVTFVNDDGSVLDIQYVDKGGSATDPITRTENPIPIPLKKSTVSTDYTYDKWNLSLTNVFSDRTITATYSESVREYTVKFVANGVVLQTETAPYGSSVIYNGDIPTYTAEESAYVYNLYAGWDKFGLVDGDKTINAVYDRFVYTDGCFDDLELRDMRPVQIYAMTQLGIYQNYVSIKDNVKFNMGTDYSYSNIDEELLISEETVFNGTNYLDTGIELLKEDIGWTLVLDYKWHSGNNANAVLAQCFQGDGTNGFRLRNSSGSNIFWGTSSTSIAPEGNRDILVLRHIAGETKLHVYKGSLPSNEIAYATLSASRSVTSNNATLVFGCAKADDGIYENYAKGSIYWAKLWHEDLGDSACRQLAMWTHETIPLDVYGFRQYYCADGSGSRSTISFLMSKALENSMQLNSSTSNVGGWSSWSLNSFLNERFYNAIPVEWKQLIKQVKISSTSGNMSSEITTSNCYISIPAIAQLDSGYNYEPYASECGVGEMQTIPYMTSNENRIRLINDGTAVSYWTRSPYVSYANYIFSVDETGYTNGFSYGIDSKHVVLEISI